MANRFPEAVMNQIRNRELMAEALDAQDRAKKRNAMMYRLVFLGVPIGIAVNYFAGGTVSMPAFAGKIPGLNKIASEKNILAKAEAQLKAGAGKTGAASASTAGNEKSTGSSESVASNTDSDSGVDDMIAEIEKRDQEMRNNLSKVTGKKFPNPNMTGAQAGAMAQASADGPSGENSRPGLDEAGDGETTRAPASTSFVNLSVAHEGGPEKQYTPVLAPELLFADLEAKPAHSPGQYALATAEENQRLVQPATQRASPGYTRTDSFPDPALIK